jgi:preprotein translocase subunit YajC
LDFRSKKQEKNAAKRKYLQKGLASEEKRGYNIGNHYFGGVHMNVQAIFAEGTTGNPGGSWVMIVMLVLMFAVFYFFGIRPQKKQEKEATAMRNGLSVGDEVTTIGGIIGKIVSIKEETCVIETTHERTKIRILKSAVSRVDVKAEDAEG